MKWHRDRNGEWHPEHQHQPPGLLDELWRLLVWLIPLAAIGWTVIALVERGQ